MLPRMMLWKLLLLIGSLLWGFVPASAGHTASLQDDPPEAITLENGYRIIFRGVTYAPDGRSTWRYRVEELASAQDLSNWVLALPDCASIVTAAPEPWEAVNPDPNAQLSGIKWETGAGFRQGDFSLTLTEPWAIGITDVAAKGPDLAYGTIAGPVCRPAARVALAKTVDRATAQAGDLLAYTITLSNMGSTAVTGVQLSDPIPTGTTYVDNLQVSGGVGSYDQATNQVLWRGDLGVGEQYILTFSVRIQEGVSPASTITNTVALGEQHTSATTRIEPASAPSLFRVYLPWIRS